VLNRGLSGYNTAHAHAILDGLSTRRGLLTGTSVLATIFFGANDAAAPESFQAVPLEVSSPFPDMTVVARPARGSRPRKQLGRSSGLLARRSLLTQPCMARSLTRAAQSCMARSLTRAARAVLRRQPARHPRAPPPRRPRCAARARTASSAPSRPGRGGGGGGLSAAKRKSQTRCRDSDTLP
jgi:hypothetical protein